MPTVFVHSMFRCSPERAFAALTDHEAFRDVPGVSAKRVRDGGEDPNGLGAVRRMGGAGVWFDEEVTSFHPPSEYTYRIIGGTFPIEHEGGRVTVTATPEGAGVTWETRFTVRTPVFSDAANRLAQRVIRASLLRLMRSARRRAEGA